MQFNHLGFKTDLIRLLSQKPAASRGSGRGRGRWGVKEGLSSMFFLLFRISVISGERWEVATLSHCALHELN